MVASGLVSGMSGKCPVVSYLVSGSVRKGVRKGVQSSGNVRKRCPVVRSGLNNVPPVLAFQPMFGVLTELGRYIAGVPPTAVGAC